MSAAEAPEISIVIPVYNEEESLESLFAELWPVVSGLGRTFEVIFVDDGSRDRSLAMLKKFCAEHEGALTIELCTNFGQHMAIMAGFDHARGRKIITLDADLQNPPSEIPKLIAALDEGHDVVGTYRVGRRDPIFRKAASRCVNKITNRIAKLHISDYGCMLRAYRRHIVEAMLQCNERSTFIPVLGNSFARNTCEIPVKHSERASGESKYSLWKLINLQFNLLTCMTTIPLRVLTYFGLFAAFCGYVLSIYIVIRRFCWADGDSWGQGGIFTLFAIMFIFTGIQMIGIGMIGEYIGRIYNDVRARPRYFIEEVCGRKEEK